MCNSLATNLNIKYYIFVVFFCILIVIVIFFNYSIFNKLQFSTFYVIGTQSDAIINKNPLNFSCNPIVKNSNQYYVNISDRTYPTHLNMHMNKSINFSCLNQKKSVKVILLWNKFFGNSEYYYGLGRIDPFIKNNCPVTQCELTDDRSHLDKSDLVVTHMRDSLNNLPHKSHSNQRWVFLLYESPTNSPNFYSNPNLRNFYSLSSTYKIDSDFPGFYEADSRMNWEFNSNFNEDFDFHINKKEFAAAVISNCGAGSRRLEYIKQMQNYVVIDVFGKCGKQCPTVSKYNRKITGDCKKIIGTDYKFYFAFENSICSDYITEKFFIILAYDIIPVVLGGGRYDYYIPKSGYINALDFQSPKHLSDYLNYLDSNKTAYNEYFRWKKHVRFDSTGKNFGNIFCDMCIYLHLEDYFGLRKSTINMQNFWNVNNDCTNLNF